MQTTHDHLMNGSVVLEQPACSYRVAIDPIFLAAAIPAQGCETILDVGCGVGAAMLCLAKRLPDVHITGLELQTECAQLAVKNIIANGLSQRLQIVQGNLLLPPSSLQIGHFHHVVTNPPYYIRNKSTVPNHIGRAIANIEDQVSLEQWIGFCLSMTRPKGTVSLILPADRLLEILSIFQAQVGEISIYPLWPTDCKPAKRLIIRARKNSPSAVKIYPGLILHTGQGQYSAYAEQVLRNCQPIDF